MPYYQNPHDVTRLPAWQLLSEHRQVMGDFSLRRAFADDPQRFASFSVDGCGLFLDYSKNLANEQTIELLMRLAREAGLQQSIEAMLDGKPVNASEGRPALHTALRRPVGEQILVNGQDVMPEVHHVLQQMTDLVGRIHSSLWRGYSEKSITDVVNIGIGGSYLGPELVSEALLPFRQRGVRCHYLANIDGSEFRELTARLNAETTLFIVSSKSFGTLETLKNALA
ncbi:MAG TPA: glucose-6-phosphate isomerase, partial [Pseudomonas sp.]|nr:glucose-6-phosphate isomerase [Pseudomonas sp.]